MSEKSIWDDMKDSGVSRRDFLKTCGAIAAMIGLRKVPFAHGKTLARPGVQSRAVHLVAAALEAKPKVPLIWLEFQACTGCTEALSRSSSPSLKDLVLTAITVEYHETLMAAAGKQAEDSKKNAMARYAGKYILVVDGSVPLRDDGACCVVSGRTALDLIREAAEGAAAIIATGTCASFGGIPEARPDPTTSVSVQKALPGRPVINIPGCPAIPEVFTGVVAQYLVFGKLPELDDLSRPKTYYGNTIHDRCLRRPFYEAGKFAVSFDDPGARRGWCLYKLGCKGPTTYNACATIKWDSGLSFPVQSGHPCLGCSQPGFWDGGGFYQGQSAALLKPGTAALGIAAGIGAVAGIGIATANRARKRKLRKAGRTP